MSTAALQRQIDKLAATISQIKPKPPVKSILLGVPPDDASDAVKAAYQAELAAAQAGGVQVIGLVGIKPGTFTKEKESTWQPNPSSTRLNASRQHSMR